MENGQVVISKRGVNTGVALNGTTAIVTHSEENLDTSEMGLIAAIDAKAKGDTESLLTPVQREVIGEEEQKHQ